MKTTIMLLQQLTSHLEPMEGRRHNISLAEDQKTLIVALSANGGWYKFTLDDGDFAKDSTTLTDEILELFRSAVHEEASKQEAPKSGD